MAFVVVLDACVLYPASLRDTLLRLAEVEMYDVKWSQRILDEAVDNLVDDSRMDRDQAMYLMQCMNEAFEDALVPGDAIDQVEPSMTNHPKDRHVLAAAVVSGAEHVITSNLKDFDAEATQPHDVDAVHPDAFLLAMLDLDPELVIRVLGRQAADCRNPPKTLDDILDALAVSVPDFVARVHDIIAVDDR
jgi:predicted nucleic acid-binding protein